MTFADKKIEEFESKIIPLLVDTAAAGKICFKEVDNLKNWLKQTIAEAEKNGERMAYYDCRKILRSNYEAVALDKIKEKILIGGG